jgi:hypothetical protein
VFSEGSHEWVTEGEKAGAIAFVRRFGGKAVFVTANLTKGDVKFKTGVKGGGSVLLSERGELAADGTCRLGPYGYVVVEL